MKKIKYILFTMLSFFAFITFASADTYQLKVTAGGVNVRTGPGTNYSKAGTAVEGGLYSITSTSKVASEKGCTNGWYLFNFNGTNGYICSDYAQIITYSTANLSTCSSQLLAKGFPSSYVTKLCTLKSAHPNWNFEPLQTGTDFSEAVSRESTCGLSYVYTTAGSGYIDSSCNNAYKTTGNGWYPASKTAVAYYMDPRNFMDESHIFQFENLTFSESMAGYYPGGINNILKNAAFYQYHVNNGTDFSNLLTAASRAQNVNAIFLASRILQELGTSTSLYNLYSGVYTGYSNAYYSYYNFVNYGVSDSCATTYGTTYCGLQAAKTEGWNSVYNGLYGAAEFIGGAYISQGQYTGYLQKFNLVPKNASRKYLHQYMTNIAAPSSESVSSYKSYSSLGMIDAPYTFYIPVYSNIDSTITNSSSGVNSGGSSTVISSEISTIITSSGYKFYGSEFKGVVPYTDASTIINAIQSVGGKATVKDAYGNVVTSGQVGTGYKVVVSNSSSSQEFNIIINGDTNGDGKVTAVDLLQVQKAILGTYSMGANDYAAGDTNDDGKVTAIDLLQVQKHILGTFTINQ